MSRLLPSDVLERLSRLDLGVRGVAGGGRAGERLAGGAGIGTLFREHRAYAPGDDPRTVDWNAFGRLRTLHVKVFEAEENVDLHLLVDRSPSMGSGPGSKLETALRIAAALGAVGLARGATVRTQPLPTARPGSPVRQAFRGRAGTSGLLDALAAVEPLAGEPLGRALRPVFPRLRRRGLAILVTDFLDEAAGPGGWRLAVDFLRHRRVRLVGVHVIAPEERDPGVLGSVRLVDAEGGGEIDVHVDAARAAAYRAAFTRHVREVAGYLREREALHVEVTAGSAPAEVVRSLLRAGLLR